MKKTFFLIFMLSGSNVFSQHTVGFNQCDSAEIVTIPANGKFKADTCGWAIVLNPKAIERMAGANIRSEEAMRVLKERLEVGNQISETKSTLIAKFDALIDQDTTYYNRLLAKYIKTDSLAVESTKLTSRVIRISYITSITLGATAGGVIGAEKGKFLLSALLGAVVGGGLNWVLLRL